MPRRTRRSFFIRIILAVVLFLTSSVVTPTIAKAEQKVLILYSYNDALPWQKSLRQGLYARLDEIGGDVVLFEERFDSARLDVQRAETSWAEYLQRKYAGTTFDLVMAESTSASRFLVNHPTLFGKAVRYLINPGKIKITNGHENVIAVNEDYEQNLRVALAMSPQARHLIFISNLEPQTHLVAQRAWEEHFKGRVSFEVWHDNFTFEELYERVSHLDKDTIIIYAPVGHDRTGARAVPYVVLQDLAKNSSVPVFTSHDTLLGSGAIGGFLMSSERVGMFMADLAAGFRPDKIPNETFFANMFDSRALQRWGIADSSLPPGSVIRFQTPSFYEQNRFFIIYGVPLILIETLILIWLMHLMHTRRMATSALKLSEQRFRILAKVSPAGIFHTDSKGNYTYVNDRWCELAGMSEAEALGVDWTKAIAPEDRERVLSEWHHTIENHIPFRSEYRFKRSDGKTNWLLAQADPETNDSGQVVGYVGVITNITESKNQSEQLRRSQKMEALGKLTGGVAHDYNNILAVILGYSELLESSLQEQSKLASYAHNITHASKRGAALTKKLLDFSKYKSSKTEKLDINKLLLEERNMLERTLTSRIQLSYKLTDNLWPAWLDSGDLEDTILNLSINAMHAIEMGGQITFATANEHINESDARALQLEKGNYVSLSVTDTGCGMDEETKDRIFEPFFTTKGENGTGLGLSQVYGFVKRSGGTIVVDSSPGHGTHITLYFPSFCESDVKDKLS